MSTQPQSTELRDPLLENDSFECGAPDQTEAANETSIVVADANGERGSKSRTENVTIACVLITSHDISC